MKSLGSSHIIPGFFSKIKEQSNKFLTNFFIGSPVSDLWIRNNLVEFEDAGSTVFIRRKNAGFYNLYFITISDEALRRDIKSLLKENPGDLFVADIVGSGGNSLKLHNAFSETGFYQHTSLVRMSKVNSFDENNIVDKRIIKADKNAGLKVHSMLHLFFDKYAEQLPLEEEINNHVENGGILIYSDNQTDIEGFLIYDLIGQTSYLRYWFVHPDHRDKKIGSALLRSYFAESRSTKRLIFWVIDTNENAIMRYKHYGFKEEDMKDFVMINKFIHHEK